MRAEELARLVRHYKDAVDRERRARQEFQRAEEALPIRKAEAVKALKEYGRPFVFDGHIVRLVGDVIELEPVEVVS